MGKGGRFGKYGEQKRLKRLHPRRQRSFFSKIPMKFPDRETLQKEKRAFRPSGTLIQGPTDRRKIRVSIS